MAQQQSHLEAFDTDPVLLPHTDPTLSALGHSLVTNRHILKNRTNLALSLGQPLSLINSCNPPTISDSGALIVPKLQIKMPKHREVKKRAQGHPASKLGMGNEAEGQQNSRVYTLKKKEKGKKYKFLFFCRKQNTTQNYRN